MFCSTVLVRGELFFFFLITIIVCLILFLERMRNWNAFLPKS